MDRLTTDNPQDNVTNMLNIAFTKDGKVWMRGCGDDDKDCTLSSLVERLCKKYGCESDVDSTNTIDFGEKMADCACGMCCLVANAYFGLVQAAELRGRLKQYEDAEEDLSAEKLSLISRRILRNALLSKKVVRDSDCQCGVEDGFDECIRAIGAASTFDFGFVRHGNWSEEKGWGEGIADKAVEAAYVAMRKEDKPC